MQYDKVKIFNLALNVLLLSRQIINVDTDKSNEAVILRSNYDIAFNATLEDLDLDSISSQITLELSQKNPNHLWGYAYKYPSDCAFLRRIQSCAEIDDRYTHIPKRVAMIGSQKVILTNQEDAVAEYISNVVSIASLSATAGLCVAHRLAALSAPLITGKGAKTLIDTIEGKYTFYKAQAQEQDARENFNFTDERQMSEFVKERTS